MTQSRLRCGTCIIRSFALMWAPSSWSRIHPRGWPRSSPMKKINFSNCFAGLFILLSCRVSIHILRLYEHLLLRIFAFILHVTFVTVLFLVSRHVFPIYIFLFITQSLCTLHTHMYKHIYAQKHVQLKLLQTKRSRNFGSKHIELD